MISKFFTIKTLTAVGIALGFILLLLLFYYAIDVVMLTFAACLVAVFLRGLANFLTKYINIGEGKAVLLVSLILVLLLAGGVALLAPQVSEQIPHLREELPRSAQTVSEYISQFPWGRAIIQQLPSVEAVEEKVMTMGFLTSVGGFFSTTLGVIVNFFIAILLAIYLAAEPKIYIHGFVKLFPVDSRERIHEVVLRIGDTLQWWLLGKGGSMLTIGVLTWIGLSVLGVPMALSLGLIAGLLSFIPNFGPILSAIPAILLAFIESPITAVYVIGLYLGVQFIESYFVTPWIERRTILLPPALTIIFQLTLGVLTGSLGLVLATPILAVVMVLLRELYIKDILGDRKPREVELEHLEESEPDIDSPVEKLEEN